MNNNVLRKDGETKLGYFKRITENRKELDLDYAEWIKLLINKDYSSENARKMYYCVNELLKELEEEQINKLSDEDMIKHIEDKRLELERERKRIQTLKVEYNRNLTRDVRQEVFYNSIKDSIERLPLPNFDTPDYIDNTGSYILCWADLHYGADFKSENNTYSREECRYRMEYLAAQVKNKCLKLGISDLVICGLGDYIQGMLRISDVKLNDIPVVESVVEVSRLVAQTLNSISEVVNIKYYHTMASNHTQTRPINSKKLLSQEDLEVVIGNYIKDMLLNNDRIEVVLSDKDYHSFKLEGQNILSLHGHQVGNVKNAIKDYSMLHRKFYDIILMGHLHGGQSLSVGELDGNSEIKIIPSIVGSDPYSDTLKLGSKSMAKMFKIERELGITEEYTFVLN